MVTSNPRSTSEKDAKAPAETGSSVEPMLMEIAWEVANQIGGIYTVLRSKVPSMISRWGTRYCLVGPFNPRMVRWSSGSTIEPPYAPSRMAALM